MAAHLFTRVATPTPLLRQPPIPSLPQVSGCYIEGLDDGGRFLNDLDNSGRSPEVCAQACLNDPNCISFDAGKVVEGNPRLDDCYLSYDDRSSERVKANALFKCNSPQFDYFEKKAAYRDDDTRCAPGSASQTGFPPCKKCPADYFSNAAGTLCQPCPQGTISFAGAGGVRDCFPVDLSRDGANGAFRLGSEWIGAYNTTVRDSDGSTRQGGGRMELQVVGVSGAKVTVLASLQHGEYCAPGDVYRECRTAGLSEFYMVGNVVDKSELALQYGAWTGITDTTFNRENLQGVITVDGPNTLFSGTYGTGSFKVTERCFAAQEIGAVDPGDKFTGTYTCDRPVSASGRQPLEGEEDVRRLELFIDDVVGETVLATISFDHRDGLGEYTASGAYDPATKALRFTPKDGAAWQTSRPADVFALALIGKLSEDGEMYSGQPSDNQKCACLGLDGVPSTNVDPKTGSACQQWDEYQRDFEWCYVSEECAEAIEEDAPASGFHYARCERPTCSSFSLVRICSDASTLCAAGWTPHNSRCYKRSDATATFGEAQAACSRDDATLASVHSIQENAFLVDLQSSRGSEVARTWLGADKADGSAAFGWLDNTHFGFVDWASSEPAEADRCAYLDHAQDGMWVGEGDCGSGGTTASYVCKQLPLARERSCGCIGENDANGFGSVCKTWSSGVPAWCYVDKGCPRALENPEAKLWWAYCYEDAFSTTTAGAVETTAFSTPDPIQCGVGQYQDGNACTPCLTADACASGETLVGACLAFAGPRCVACHASCASCSGARSTDCDTCKDGLLKTPDGRCVATCPSGQYRIEGSDSCGRCAVVCGACSGPGASECTSCDVGGSLFLSGSSCVSACPAGTYSNERTQTCTPCTACGADAYQVETCGGGRDATCAGLTQCLAGREFERVAATATSDRRCRALTECKTGQEVGAEPTATSDRLCRDCAGKTDDDYTWRTPCTTCEPGVYLPARSKGPCQLSSCSPGTADIDKNTSTPCQVCEEGATYQPQSGATECLALTTCGAGFVEAQAPTTSTDRVCQGCPSGTFKAEAGPGVCQPVRDCLPGTEESSSPTSIADRGCTVCAAGTFAAGNNTKCQAWSSCSAGTETASPPTASSDRVCRACADGTFSVAGEACRPFSVCTVEQYVDNGRPPSPSMDRTCRNATMCLESEYVLRPLLADVDRECDTLTVCKGAEFEATAPRRDPNLGMYVSDRVCEPCSTCPQGRTQTAACSDTADTLCESCTTCDPGTWQEVACTASEDTSCATCSECDADTQFIAKACEVLADTQCQALTVCEGNLFEAQAPTDTSDRLCQPAQTCAPGTFVSQDVSATADRVCTPCAAGTFSDKDNAASCTALRECSAGTFVAFSGNATSNAQCGACELAASFSTGPNAAGCTAVAAPCAPGTFEDAAPTVTSDRACLPCPNGQFSVTSGAGTCTPWRKCDAGEEQSVAPTSTSDRVCRVCGAEFFQDVVGALQCKAKRLCGPGEEELSAGGATEDRQCQPCEAGVTFKETVDVRGANANCGAACLVCQKVRTCAAGEEETAAPTLTSDRECVSCEAGVSFKASAGVDSRCAAVEVCAAGEEQIIAPTPSTDRGEGQGVGWQRAGGVGYVGVNVFFRRRIVSSVFPCCDGSQPRFLCLTPCLWLPSPSVCRLCPDGTFKPVAGQSSCSAATTCLPGEFILKDVPPTKDANRICAPCNVNLTAGVRSWPRVWSKGLRLLLAVVQPGLASHAFPPYRPRPRRSRRSPRKAMLPRVAT